MGSDDVEEETFGYCRAHRERRQFDWQMGTIHAELQLQETCRDITFVKRCPWCVRLVLDDH